MEVYFKDLISKEASLEKLVDDLSRVVQGADDYARAVGANVPDDVRNEVVGRLQSLKDGCQELRRRAVEGAHATDRLVRKNPYSALTILFAAGFLVGAAVACRRRKD
jgi:ElaB/YqjD/DUF883 family membrane-anchored ribosome-binding protein